MSDKILLEAKPKYYTLKWFTDCTPFITFFSLIFAGVVNSLLFGCILYLTLIIITHSFRKGIYENTSYKLYENRITFDEGFMGHSHKVIYYKDIREISLEQGPIQRKLGIGSILLNTAATESHGIRIKDIEASEDFYKKVDGIIHAS